MATAPPDKIRATKTIIIIIIIMIMFIYAYIHVYKCFKLINNFKSWSNDNNTCNGPRISHRLSI